MLYGALCMCVCVCEWVWEVWEVLGRWCMHKIWRRISGKVELERVQGKSSDASLTFPRWTFSQFQPLLLLPHFRHFMCVLVWVLAAHTHTLTNTNTCMQKYFSAEYVCVSVFGAEISVKAASLQLSDVLGALPLLFPLLHLTPHSHPPRSPAKTALPLDQHFDVVDAVERCRCLCSASLQLHSLCHR